MALVTTTHGHINDTNASILVVTEDTEEMNSQLSNEEYSLWIKAVYVIFGTVSLVTSVIAIGVLHRTKKMPQNAKFLTFWLLVFDCLYIVVTSVQNFIVDPAIIVNIQIFTLILIQCSCLTICLMAVERLVLFKWPYVYNRHCRKTVLRNIAFATWAISSFILLTDRYLGCYLEYRSTISFDEERPCLGLNIYFVFVVCLVLGVSTVCYCNIFQIIQRQTKNRQGGGALSFLNTAKELRGYRMTFAVLMFLFVIYLTMIAFLILRILEYVDAIKAFEMRVFVEIVMLLNCLLDPYLYVMWFRESRMELIKICCFWNAHVQEKVEAMRIEIFDIVTKENAPRGLA